MVQRMRELLDSVLAVEGELRTLFDGATVGRAAIVAQVRQRLVKLGDEARLLVASAGMVSGLLEEGLRLSMLPPARSFFDAVLEGAWDGLAFPGERVDEAWLRAAAAELLWVSSRRACCRSIGRVCLIRLVGRMPNSSLSGSCGCCGRGRTSVTSLAWWPDSWPIGS